MSPLLTCIKCSGQVTVYGSDRLDHSDGRQTRGLTPEGGGMSETKESITGRALNLTELVAYQEGSIISRTLIDKKMGTLTVFAFGEGQGLSEHTVPYDAFVQILDGEAEVTIDGTVHPLAAGQTIIMPADRPHSLKGVKRFKMLLVMIRA
jgi:quercetin dioxygenase-like cupin family protein